MLRDLLSIIVLTPACCWNWNTYYFLLVKGIPMTFQNMSGALATPKDKLLKLYGRWF